MRRGPSSAAPLRDPARESSRAGAAAPAGSDGPGIMLVAGEASGDLHGATLCGALAELAPGWRLFGMGGARMAAAGMDVLVSVTARAGVVGSGQGWRLLMLYGAYLRLVRRLETAPLPRALVLIDFPEFNFRLARAAHRAGVPVVYFIPPQIWAWRAGRVRTIARLVTRVLAVFPFEVPLYRAAGVPVDFVGPPLGVTLRGAPSRPARRRRPRLATAAVVFRLLPSRRTSVVEP